jgi:hypothetical protein
MAYVSITGDYLLGKRKQATLEQVREAVRQHVRDSKLDQLSKAMMQAMVDRSYTMEALQALCRSYGISGYEGELFMDKAAEIKLIKDQQAALYKRLEKLEHGKWGKEPANGGMFKIEKTFYAGGAKYKYLAIREAGVWHLSGTSADAKKTYSWEALKAFAGSRARVWKLTVAEELLD